MLRDDDVFTTSDAASAPLDTHELEVYLLRGLAGLVSLAASNSDGFTPEMVETLGWLLNERSDRLAAAHEKELREARGDPEPAPGDPADASSAE